MIARLLLLVVLSMLATQPAFAQWGMEWDNALKESESWLSEYRETEGAAAKEREYKELLEAYPMDTTTQRRIVYDYLHSDLAAAWLSEENKEKHDVYKEQVNDGRMLYGFVSSALDSWIAAEENLELTVDIAGQYLSDLLQARSEDSGYSYQAHGMFLEDFVRVESMRGNYRQALQQVREANDSMLLMLFGTPAFLDSYADVMAETGNHQALLDLLTEAIENGQQNEKITAALKMAYKGVHGDLSGYKAFLKPLEETLYREVYEEVAEERIEDPQPAPAFTLKNLEGETVSLKDLRGKVVVVDFWATWCGPCKRSFPAMQTAVNEFSDDPEVQFLFIDTWEERSNHPDIKAAVEQFIEEEGYTFEVLLDNETQVVADFSVSGIPTKFVIDKEGMIQFKSVGFSGMDAKLVNEMKAMIEQAKQ